MIRMQFPTAALSGLALLMQIALPGSAAGATLSSGETALGILGAPGYELSWDFSASAGDRVIVTTSTIDGGVQPEIHLTPSGGTEEAASVGPLSWHRVDHRLLETNTYTITVRESGTNATGWCAIALAVVPGAATHASDPDGGTLASGETRVGSLLYRADTDIFQFEGQAGNRVLITTATLSGSSVSPEIYLYPPGGGAAEASDAGTPVTHRLDHHLAATGTYTIIVSDNAFNSEGNYAIALALIPGAATSAADPDGGTIASGETKIGTLWARADTDVFQFAGQAGDRVVLTSAAYASSVAPEISLYPPGGGALEAADTGTAAEHRLETVLAATGTYTVIVEDNGLNSEGAYALALAKMPGATSSAADTDGGTIASGETRTGTLSGEADTDLYQFDALAGDRVIITSSELTGGVQPEIFLYAPAAGALEASSTGLFREHRLERVLAQTGTYTILVSDSGLNTEGAYAVALARIPGSATSATDTDGGTILSGETRYGTLANQADTDLFQFYGEAGDRVVVAASSFTGGLEPEIYLYPPGGGPLEKSVTLLDAPFVYRLDWQLQQTGVYTILVADGGLNTSGGYGISLAKIPGLPSSPGDSEGGILSSSDTRSGSLIGEADTDIYQFYGLAGDHVVLSASRTAVGGEPEIYLYPPGGGEAESSATGNLTSKSLEWDLLSDGLYSVVVSDYGLDGQGYYELSYSNTTSAYRSGVYGLFPPNGATVIATEELLRWDPVPDAAEYDVFFGSNPLGAPLFTATVTEPSLPFPEKVTGIPYFWQVVARTPSGDLAGPLSWYTLMDNPVIYTDDFTDGGTSGDADWLDLSRSWTVTPAKQFSSATGFDNRALYRHLPRFLTGTLETRFKLKGTKTRANASIIFAYQGDNQRYRYVTVRKGRLLVGQVGSLGEEGGGVKRSRKLRYGVNRFYRLTVSQDSDGTVNVYWNGGTRPRLTHRFGKPVEGWTGYRVWNAKSIFDDFLAEEAAALP